VTHRPKYACEQAVVQAPAPERLIKGGLPTEAMVASVLVAKYAEIVNGRAQKTYGHSKPFEEWEVVLKDHHEGYIDWAEFERNQKQLAANAYGRAGDAKSGRGGHALLVGLLGCARCGRRLKVAYQGRSARAYRCDNPNLMLGSARCLTFGSSRVDPAVARELLRAVEPIAVEAAVEAERLHMEQVNERRHILELDPAKGPLRSLASRTPLRGL
jgi:hypothetical protein